MQPLRRVHKPARVGAGTKGVLVISVGLSPQVVTETVHALACERGERIDEIYMWTTTDGEKVIESTLLDGGQGALYRLFADYGLPVPAVYVKVFGRTADAPAGLRLTIDRPLEDIRSRRDNEVVADTLMRFFQEQTTDPARRLFCSLAGARKTIGAYLALALQFFGREGDRLLHVLVPRRFEEDRSFFYPPPDAPPGLIDLVEVPVALLREHLHVLSAIDGPLLSYSQLVDEVQEELAHLKDPPVLAVQRPLEVLIGEISVALPRLPRVVYTVLAARRLRCAAECRGCPRCFVTLEEIQDARLAEPMRRLVAFGGFRDHRLEQLSRWTTAERDPERRLEAFRQTRARINRTIGDRPGRRVYHVVRAEWGERAGYGIALSPDRIHLPPEVAGVWGE